MDQMAAKAKNVVNDVVGAVTGGSTTSGNSASNAAHEAKGEAKGEPEEKARSPASSDLARTLAPTRSTCRDNGKSVAGLRNWEKRTTMPAPWVGLHLKRTSKNAEATHATHQSTLGNRESVLAGGEKKEGLVINRL